MIGLGSNRLTVCRRGGMSVTQAGRGGMEWLAGDGLRGRSPYSDLATAYLQQHYSAYWSEIMSYGLNNPTMVPYINEDPDVICSLMDVGKVRWIENVGNACIKTDLYPIEHDYLESWFYNINGRYAIFLDNGYCYFGVENRNLSARHGILNSTGTTTITWTSDIQHFVYDDGVAKLNGNNVNVTNGSQWNQGWPYHFIMRPDWARDKMRIVKNYIRDNLIVPFVLGEARTAAQCYPQSAQAAGAKGMMNLLTGIFYPNANSSGSFTISETPAS